MIDVHKLGNDLHDQGYHVDWIQAADRDGYVLRISPIAEHPESSVKKWDAQCDEQLRTSIKDHPIPAGVKMISAKLK